MGNDNQKYAIKYPPGFDEKNTQVDHDLSYFKNDLGAAQRSGKSSGIKERAANRKKLKLLEMGVNDMAQMRVEAMSKKGVYSDEDHARWQEMIDANVAQVKEIKALMEGGSRRTAKRSASKEGPTADDYLRGDGSMRGADGRPKENSSGPGLRTGKMSAQEKAAMQELNDKDGVMDDLADQITENLEYLNMRAEMIGEEIDSQKVLVEEVNSRAAKTKDRTHKLNSDIRDTMVKDGMQKEEQKKKKKGKGGILEGGGDMKTKMATSMLKGMIK